MNRWTLEIVIFFCLVQRSERACEHPGFVLHLILEDKEINFEPNLKLYEEVLRNVYEFMLSSINMVPRVETKLFPEWVRRVCFWGLYMLDS